MTITLHLPPDIEQLYLAEAQARGLPLERVMQEALVAARLSTIEPTCQNPGKETPDDWMRRFAAWSEGPAHANLPDLPDEALSRESIYADRGL